MIKTVSLSPKHLLLALVTVIIWGLNFIAIYVGLKGFPPFLLCALRFGFTAFPWVFILPRPKAPLLHIVGYGVFTFALQFGFLFSGIYLGLSPGLSSLMIQVQVFFSIGLAVLFFQDKPTAWKIYGSLISFIGIGIVGAQVSVDSSFLGLLLVLLAALSWSLGNMFTKKVDAQSPVSLVAWGNLAAFPFMAAFSLLMEGPDLILTSLQNASWATIGAIFYIVYFSSLIGYSAWGFLLNSYPTSTIVPFSLLIPVVGFFGSIVFLGEELTSWKLIAAFFVMAGLVFNLLEKQIQQQLQKIKSRLIKQS